MRFGSPPAGSALNVTPENAASVDISKVVQTLTANGGGVELPFSAPASAGALKLSSRSGDINQSILTNIGGWVYISALQVPGNRIYELNTSVTVDESCYRSWFAGAQWDASGNPAEDVTHTCSGSSGGTPLTGITLSANTLIKGSNTTINITPLPSAASLGSCSLVYAQGDSNLLNLSGATIALAGGSNSITTSKQVTLQCGASVSANITVLPSNVPLTGIALSKSALLSNDLQTVVTVTPVPATALLPSACQAFGSDGVTQSPYVKFSGNQFSLLEAAKTNITEVKRELVIRCGSDTAKTTFTIEVPLQITDRIANDGTLTLAFQFKPEAFSGPAKSRVWVIGYAPKNQMFGLMNDVYLYRTEAGVWDVLYQSFDFDKIAFMHIAELKDSQEMIIPTGVRKSDLALLGVEIHFFYQVEDGVLKYLGKVFPH